MSWARRGPGAPEPQPYAPPAGPAPASHPQAFGNQSNMYPNYQGAPQSNNTQQAPFWPGQGQPPPQYNQQFGMAYQQDYGQNANQYYQQPTQNVQNYSNQRYNIQPGYQHNYYQNQGVQQPNFSQHKATADGWEDNWDWGWDESGKQAQNIVGQNPTQAQAPTQSQQPVFNNANVIEESFSNVSASTWNWAMDDKKDGKESAGPIKQENNDIASLPVENTILDNNTLNEANPRSSSNLSTQPTEEVRTLGDREVVKERLPNLALGKRHADNLTPQWSIESQMSQESSDGPHTHSESTYRSDNQSRNSSKSSPGPNMDNSNFNYSQLGFDETAKQNSEWSTQSTDEHTVVDGIQRGSSRHSSHDEISNSLQEMRISNQENTNHQSYRENSKPENIPPSHSPASLPPPISALPVPPPVALPPPSPMSSASLVPSMTTLPPPTNFPTSSQNPFKHAGPFSHKSMTSVTPASSVSSAFTPQLSSNTLTSPSAVNMVSQQRAPVGFGANLETTPDNSERPDQPQVSTFRPMSATQQVPENLEVAPRSDRNEYLQTAHLSGGDYGENTDFSCNMPLSGMRRMVVGQQETEYSQNLNMAGDEPPPGLARMVPGQHTEADNTYSQPSDNYLDRHIDGQLTEGGSRPYRQADGQQTPPPGRSTERMPIGLDRMVPGEPSNNEYPQYQSPSYTANEQRVVTGLDHDYPIQTNAGPSDVREQNVDGSDYTEPTSRNPPRNVNNDSAPEEQQREITMEGENLQDLSIISADITYSNTREQIEAGTDRRTDLSDSIEHAASSSRRHSLNRGNTSGDESERDRAFKASPRRDRDKHKSSRDRDRDGRYSRDDRKFERDAERRSGREDKSVHKERRDRDRDESPGARRHQRSNRSRRYETEDTDYYSDREREKRRYREGSYTSKPPRPRDDRDRDRDRERSRRHHAGERDRDRYERRYRDIDPTRKYGNLRRERDDDERRRGEYSPARAESRSLGGTDEDAGAVAPERRRSDRHRRSRHSRDPYYESYSGSGSGAYDAYAVQRQQYEYYEHLRLTNPAAYMLVYKQLMAGQAPLAPHAPHAPLAPALYPEGYTSLYEGRGEERGSVHSGRSSANGLKATDTYYGAYRHDAASARDAPSLPSHLSDRDASLNLQLEESTVRSERMTPFKFSTAHIKGCISSRDVVIVRPSYPVDGRPATVQILSLAAAVAHTPEAVELAAYPGPLVKGVTHKKSVIEYCGRRVRSVADGARADSVGYVLVWELLALLLRQNGVVVGTDIAELLMKNKQDYEHENKQQQHTEGGHMSSASETREPRDEGSVREMDKLGPTEHKEEEPNKPIIDEKAAVERLRELLIVGDRQEAFEWCLSCGLWGHALALCGDGARARVRAQLCARFLAGVPRTDPLHTLYTALQAKTPPAATCVSDERWGDWRPHAAMILANASAKPDQDRRTLTQIGDSLLSRGLLYSAQFCYMSAGVQFSAHPLAPLAPARADPTPCAPPRLALLLADSRVSSLHQLATNEAIFATEIYEYAMSLNQDYVINELQVYKLVLACRLADAGLYERALGYTEACARAVTSAPHHYSPRALAALAALADRLKYHDPTLQEDPPLMEESGESAEHSPRHQQWLHDVQHIATAMQAEVSASAQGSPAHAPAPPQSDAAPAPAYPDPVLTYYAPQQYGWGEQPPQAPPQYVEPEESADYAAQYYQQQQQQHASEQQQPIESEQQQQSYGEQAASYAPQYWQGDSPYAPHYTETVAGTEAGAEAEELQRPMITMPGTAPGKKAFYNDFDDDRPPSADQSERDSGTPATATGAGASPGSGGKKAEAATAESKKGGGGGGWLGGILTKLSLRPPNQMILPDDKNPSIVWDATQKRWRNVDGDDAAPPAAPPPPPRIPTAATPPALAQQGGASPLQYSAGGEGGGAPPPGAAVSNIFKMQKGRHIKKSYVDVFNPSGAATRPLPPPAEVFGAPAPLATGPTPNYFVPNNNNNQQAGVYEPAQLGDDSYEQYRSGI